MSTIQCKHVDLKKNKDKGCYIYDISDKQNLWLCPDCNMVLAGQIMQQLTTQVFLDNSELKKYDHFDIEEKLDEMAATINTLKLNKEDDKDVRRKQRSETGRTKGKKSKD